MKKVMSLVLAAIIMVLTLVSCSDNTVVEDNESIVDQAVQDKEPATEESAQEEPVVSDEPEGEYYESVEAFLQAYPNLASDVQESLGDIMDVTVEARDNSLVYIFTTEMLDDVADDSNMIQQTFDNMFGQLASSFGQAVVELQTYVPTLENITIEVRNTSNKVIYTKVSTAEDAESFVEGEDVELSEFADSEMSIADYVELFDGQAIYSDETFNATLEARDNDLVYVYKFNYQIEVTDELLEAMNASMESLEESAKTAAEAIKGVVTEIDNIVYEYVNFDGSVIVSYKIEV
ncbi:MAG: hypothetical protein J6K12_01325 [Clostridia bacterium]|nr:hypothetical protein [Clostridia bacterium]